jgi:putative membrane protein
MLELLPALGLGIALGCCCGLLPGLHVNSTIPLLLGLSFLFEPIAAAVILISAGITQSFVAFIPAILLGAPEDETAMGVLPGHRMLLLGRGYEAIRLTVIGGLGAVMLTVCTLPAFAFAIPGIYAMARPHIHWALLAVVCYMILSEHGLRAKALAISVFSLAGVLGLLVLNMLSVRDGLFPLLTGLFGLPVLLAAIRSKTRLPERVCFEHERLGKGAVLSGICTGSFAGILAGLLPGIGSSQAAVLAQETTGREHADIGMRKFLIAIGGITTADIIYSLHALWLIGNPRSGVAVAVGKLIEISLQHVLVFICVIVIAAGLGAYLTLKLARRMLFVLSKINYPRLCAVVALLIVVLIGLFSGPVGLAIAGCATAIGLIAILGQIRRSHAMGCLLLPTILFFAELG